MGPLREEIPAAVRIPVCSVCRIEPENNCHVILEAMFFGRPVLAYDVVYNRETTENKAYFFQDDKALGALLSATGLEGEAMLEIARRRYTWQTVMGQYEAVY